MSKRTQIEASDIQDWQQDVWPQLASRTPVGKGAQIRLHTNGCGELLVTQGESVLYRGSSPEEAAKAYNDA